MAPIFMFFMYFIFLLLQARMFDSLISNANTNFLVRILSILIPAMFILILLLKATDFAKKGSGKFGEALMKGAKMVGGLAISAATAAATGGTSLALGAASSIAATTGRATIGRAGAAIADSKWAREREIQGKFGSGVFRGAAKAVGSATYDARNVKVAGKTLASATGLNLGEGGKGGFKERKAEQIEKRNKRSKELQVGEHDPLKLKLNKTEEDLQKLLSNNADVIESLDKAIEKKRQEVSDAEKKLSAARGTAGEGAARAALTTANGELDFAKQSKKEFRSGADYMVTDSTGKTTLKTGTGVSVEALEQQKRDDAQAIKKENARRNRDFAETQKRGGFTRAKDYILSGGTYTSAAAHEAAHDIIMETKLDSGTTH
jgi:hypothetical protein